jgi:hypothetical protein
MGAGVVGISLIFVMRMDRIMCESTIILSVWLSMYWYCRCDAYGLEPVFEFV